MGTARMVPTVEAIKAIKIVSKMRSSVSLRVSLLPVMRRSSSSTISSRCKSAVSRTSGMVKRTVKLPEPSARNSATRRVVVLPGGCQITTPLALAGNPSPVRRSGSWVVLTQLGASTMVRPSLPSCDPFGSSGQGIRREMSMLRVSLA